MKSSSKRWILALGLAQQALEQASTMQIFVSSRKWNFYTPDEGFLYNACITGLVASYMRPFMEQYGLKPESKRFQKQFSRFPKRQNRISKAHTFLETLRHKTYAHFDLVHWQQKFATGSVSNNPNDLEIILNAEPGSHSIKQHTFKILPPTQMSVIEELIGFQLGRIGNKLAVPLNRLRKKSGPGVYRFTFKNRPTLNPKP